KKPPLRRFFLYLSNLTDSGLGSLAMRAMFIFRARQAFHILHFICKFPLFYGRLQKAAAISCKLAVMDFFRSMIHKITHFRFPPIKKAEKSLPLMREIFPALPSALLSATFDLLYTVIAS